MVPAEFTAHLSVAAAASEVPAEFTAYFTAAAAAAGVLIGLLFVAVSLRPETVFGDGSSAAGRAQAGATFTALVNCFFVSMVALIPDAGLGIVAIVIAIAGDLKRMQASLGRRDYLTLLSAQERLHLAELRQ